MEKVASCTMYRSFGVLGGCCCRRDWFPFPVFKSGSYSGLTSRGLSTELQQAVVSERRVWDSADSTHGLGSKENIVGIVGCHRYAAPRLFNQIERKKGQQVLRQALQGSGLTPSPPIPDVEIPVQAADVLGAELAQGSEDWMNLRKNRITASAFSTAVGFWRGDRRADLWEEKVGLREPFAGNEATRWGTTQEARAVDKYKEITGNDVDHIAFKIYKAGDEYFSWLGASPDGLIKFKNDSIQPLPAGHTLGILEVKCPHNKGRPDLGAPWDVVPAYYMPQAQGLLEIYDREVMDFYVWTINGSAVFRIKRDPEYWGLMFRIMSEFWWGHTVPAIIALKRGKSVADIQVFRPTETHPSTADIIQLSKDLARNSLMIWREQQGEVMKFRA